MFEIWEDIKGYIGFYKISNLGRIKACQRYVVNNINGGKKLVAERLLTPWDNGHGYLVISLSRENHRKNHYVHRLVASHFLENIENKPVVNHKDFNTKNNNIENLEWVTQKENIHYSINNMRKPRSVTHSSTGIKYLYKRNGKWRVSVPNKIDRCFDTYSEAIKILEVMTRHEKHIAE